MKDPSKEQAGIPAPARSNFSRHQTDRRIARQFRTDKLNGSSGLQRAQAMRAPRGPDAHGYRD
jgi:hypothetical protein